MKFRAGPAAFVMALICWGLAAYFAKSAPEMRYLPRVVSGFLAKISSRPIERNEIENIDFKGIERIRLRARAADLKIRGGGDGSMALVRLSGRARLKTDVEKILISERRGDNGFELGILPVVFRDDPRTQLALDIQLPKAFVGEIAIEVTSGSVSVEDTILRGLMVRSMSGSVRVSKTIAERLFFDSASGDFSFAGDAKQFSASSTSGNLKLKLLNADEQPRKLHSQSVSGAIEWLMPKFTNLRFTASSTSGKIESTEKMSGTNGEKVYKNGRGAIDVRAVTVSGDIRLTRSLDP